MKRVRLRRAMIVVAVVSLLGIVAAAAATASTDTRGTASASAVKVGFIYSRTGALAGFGAEEVEGFQYGLKYLKAQHNTCGGHKLSVTYVDDQTNPTAAVNAAKDLIGQGYKIIAGSTSSGSATLVAPIADQNNVLFLSGPAAADAVTGLNRHTFRSGRQSYQDVQTAAGILPPKSVGKKIVVFAEDTAFGASNFAAVSQVFGGKGHNVSKLLVPFQAADLTPYAQQLKNTNADLVFVAWPGSNAAAMWQSLDQQKVLDTTNVDDRTRRSGSVQHVRPDRRPNAKLLSHYIYQGPKNKVNTWLVAQMKAHSGHPPDLFTPDGFNPALMVCPRRAEGERRQRRQDDLGARGLAVPGAEGRGTDPQGGPRADPADVHASSSSRTNGNYEAKCSRRSRRATSSPRPPFP